MSNEDLAEEQNMAILVLRLDQSKQRGKRRQYQVVSALLCVFLFPFGVFLS